MYYKAARKDKTTMGRKKIEFNWEKFDSYLQLRASKRACASLMNMSVDTIERNVKKKYKCTFTEYAEAKLEPVRLKLVQKAISKALDGDNTMLIFSLKNLCGWADKMDQNIKGEGLTINYSRAKKED